MSINVPTHFTEQYTTNVAHLLQIMGGKLRPHVTEGSYQSEGGAVVDQYGAVEMQEVTSRFQPMGRVDAATDRVWVYPVDYSLPQMVDSFDKLRMMIDPQGPLSQAAVKAAGRKQDTVIRDAFFGTAQTGKNGGTGVAFDTTNHRIDAAVGAAADTGFNIDKIVNAIEVMENNDVDLEMEQACVMITPTQHADLLRQTQAINDDYKAGLGITRDGRGFITEILGVKVLRSRLTPSNASYRLCPMWVPSGMHLGMWKDVSARVDERPDIEGVPYQLYTTTTMGATRVEPGRVIQIECTES